MIELVMLPSQLDGGDLAEAQVVVLDVLRASSTIVTALANGAREVRLFEKTDAVLAARHTTAPPVLAAGERGCVKVPGFDLGNSPAEFGTHVIGGATILLSTTNGTRAAAAAESAAKIFVGCLLNAGATANALLERIDSGKTILLAAGTNGALALEDVIGAGAIVWHLLNQTYRTDLSLGDSAWLAYHVFIAAKPRLGAALRLGAGGINLIEGGFEEDIDLCAALDSRPVVALVQRDPLRVIKAE
ncbi:MAG TPA: 2-phosphosulfolactate phosphatase [Phycisphaerae bacterium]|nr:2-phosphosulfolactate phosphatase [Phycisphaerae bacterium]